MAAPHTQLTSGTPRVVGSFGSLADLARIDAPTARAACDLLEIRLDLLDPSPLEANPSPWAHLRGMPLLFTARRPEEGGAKSLSPQTRRQLLEASLTDASLIDIEVASIPEMTPLIQQLQNAGIPWVASFHDFSEMPDNQLIKESISIAKAAGAAIFKLAAALDSPEAMARLARIQLEDHGIPLATMGMGLLAPVSRLLCAQCGSVLNYGYLGAMPTAPGQWDAASLKQAIGRLGSLA